MIRRLFALSLLLAVATAFAQATAPLEVREAWVAEAPPGAPAQAAYMQLRNAGSTPLTVTAASSPAFASVELHRTVHEGAVARMERLPGLALAPGEGVSLAPGGLHLMLITPRQPLREGATVPLELRLDSGAVVSVEAAVRRTAMPSDAPHDHHHH
jgi:hypothetical protein